MSAPFQAEAEAATAAEVKESANGVDGCERFYLGCKMKIVGLVKHTEMNNREGLCTSACDVALCIMHLLSSECACFGAELVCLRIHRLCGA